MVIDVFNIYVGIHEQLIRYYYTGLHLCSLLSQLSVDSQWCANASIKVDSDKVRIVKIHFGQKTFRVNYRSTYMFVSLNNKYGLDKLFSFF